MAQYAQDTARGRAVADEEIAAMASVLTRRYSSAAAGVARHFAAEHEAVGDALRAGVWVRVASVIASRHAAPTLS